MDRPTIGQHVTHRGQVFAVAEYADKLGLPPGGAIVLAREMSAEDEAAWVRRTRATLHEVEGPRVMRVTGLTADLTFDEDRGWFLGEG